jgi:zinc protease
MLRLFRHSLSFSRLLAAIPMAWLVILLAFTSPAMADGKIPIESFRLQNGMEVVLIPNNRVPAVSHMLWFNVGALDDPLGKSGLAHFHEHMMFKGTPSTPAGQYSRRITNRGGNHNAFTSYDFTSYYVNISRDELPMVMEMEADRLQNLAPSKEDAVKERSVVIEERKLRVDTRPAALLSEQMDAALFRNHRYGIPVIGWHHEMETYTLEDAMEFHKRYYVPANATLVVAGDITREQLEPLAERYYGSLPEGQPIRRVTLQEPAFSVYQKLEMRHPNVQQPVVILSYLAPSVLTGKTEHSLPLLAAANLLGGSQTSWLYQKLVVERKLATGVDASYSPFDKGPSKFSISAIPAAGITPEVLETAIHEEITNWLNANLQAESTKRAIERVRTIIKAEAVYARDGLQGMAYIVGMLRTLGLPADYINQWTDKIQAITAEQVKKAASAVLQRDRVTVGYLLPVATAEAPTPKTATEPSAASGVTTAPADARKETTTQTKP